MEGPGTGCTGCTGPRLLRPSHRQVPYESFGLNLVWAWVKGSMLHQRELRTSFCDNLDVNRGIQWFMSSVSGAVKAACSSVKSSAASGLLFWIIESNISMGMKHREKE
ncbi:hypothetical protein SPBR_07987 [Sporothrix brasiliensis 5110]|uniref:Uncharacterized protein n=1 Tax=Sporothrix brasiliensis 5110 TaxID=1398154 RepID=A0A0C2IGQ5_9PEZI|nr:uncharacterized protein SPBR_07987 [Sporothrix brasiliensis 5110]KIH88391.1 hypothetical protein SPBR_07987 [Sporothrix brasiliensis 5110]